MLRIEKYLNNTIQTANGIIYKNEKKFNNKVGICYISEYGLNDLTEYLERNEDLTDKEIIEKEIGVDYKAIYKEVKGYIEYFAKKKYHKAYLYKEVCEYVFQEVSWEYICTFLNSMENNDDYEEWFDEIIDRHKSKCQSH